MLSLKKNQKYTQDYTYYQSLITHIGSGNTLEKKRVFEIFHTDVINKNPKIVLNENQKRDFFRDCFATYINFLRENSQKIINQETRRISGIMIHELATWYEGSGAYLQENLSHFIELIKHNAKSDPTLSAHLTDTLLVMFQKHRNTNHQLDDYQNPFSTLDIENLLNLFSIEVHSTNEEATLQLSWAMAYLLVEILDRNTLNYKTVYILFLYATKELDTSESWIRNKAPHFFVLCHYIKNSSLNHYSSVGSFIDFFLNQQGCSRFFESITALYLTLDHKNITYIARQYEVHGEKYDFPIEQLELLQPITLKSVLAEILVHGFLKFDPKSPKLDYFFINNFLSTGFQLLLNLPKIEYKNDALLTETLVKKIYDILAVPGYMNLDLPEFLEETQNFTYFLEKMGEAFFLNPDLGCTCTYEYTCILKELLRFKSESEMLTAFLQLDDGDFSSIILYFMSHYEETSDFVINRLVRNKQACLRILFLANLDQHSEQMKNVIGDIIGGNGNMAMAHEEFHQEISVIKTVEMLADHLMDAFSLLILLPKNPGGENGFYLDFLSFVILNKITNCFASFRNMKNGEQVILQCFKQIRPQDLIPKIIAAFRYDSQNKGNHFTLQEPYLLFLYGINTYLPVLEAILSTHPKEFDRILDFALSYPDNTQFLLGSFFHSEKICAYVLGLPQLKEEQIQSRFLSSTGFNPKNQARDFLASQVTGAMTFLKNTENAIAEGDFSMNNDCLWNFSLVINHLLMLVSEEDSNSLNEQLNELTNAVIASANNDAILGCTLANLLNRPDQALPSIIEEQAEDFFLEEEEQAKPCQRLLIGTLIIIPSSSLAQSLLKQFLTNWLRSYDMLMENRYHPARDIGVTATGNDGRGLFPYEALLNQLLNISLLHQAQEAVIRLIVPKLIEDFPKLVQMSRESHFMSEHIAISACRALLFLTMTHNPSAQIALEEQNLLPILLNQIALGSSAMQGLMYRMIDWLDPSIAFELRVVLDANTTFLTAPSFFDKQEALKLQAKAFAPLLLASDPVRHSLNRIMPNYLYGLTTGIHPNAALENQTYAGWEENLQNQLFKVSYHIFETWGLKVDAIKEMDLDLTKTIMPLSVLFTVERYLAEGFLSETPEDLNASVKLFIEKLITDKNFSPLPMLEQLLAIRQKVRKQFKTFLQDFLSHLVNIKPTEGETYSLCVIQSILKKTHKYEDLNTYSETDVNPSVENTDDDDLSFVSAIELDGDETEARPKLTVPGCFYPTPPKSDSRTEVQTGTGQEISTSTNYN